MDPTGAMELTFKKKDLRGVMENRYGLERF